MVFIRNRMQNFHWGDPVKTMLHCGHFHFHDKLSKDKMSVSKSSSHAGAEPVNYCTINRKNKPNVNIEIYDINQKQREPMYFWRPAGYRGRPKIFWYTGKILYFNKLSAGNSFIAPPAHIEWIQCSATLNFYKITKQNKTYLAQG